MPARFVLAQSLFRTNFFSTSKWLPSPSGGFILRRMSYQKLSLLVALLVLCTACPTGKKDAGAQNVAANTASTPTENFVEVPKLPAPKRPERPLPSFAGTTLRGEPFTAAQLVGKRHLIFAFKPGTPEATIAAEALSDAATFQASDNFGIVGVAIGSDTALAQEFVSKHHFDFPVIADTTLAIANKFELREAVLFLVVDADGYVVSGIGYIPTGDDAVANVTKELRSILRLPPPAGSEKSALYTAAPNFVATPLTEGKRFELAALHGKPVILIFFLHTCPHCHHALKNLQTSLKALPEAKRPQLVGISVYSRDLKAIRDSLHSEGIEDFAPILSDPDGTIGKKFGTRGGVPQIFFIDRSGLIQYHISGWEDDRHPALAKMALMKIAGEPVPVILRSTGYSGNEFCMMCHETEYETYLLTDHSKAFDTLVRHGASAKPECVSCHVVGYGKPGGFNLEDPYTARNFENVGCESCHGRGGPHLSPDFVKDRNYENTCRQCHDPKHSLNFDYAKFLPFISHKANSQIAKLSPEERRKYVTERRHLIAGTVAQDIAYVGSNACQSCHTAEYESWTKSPHGHALATLTAKSKQNDKQCLACHTTGFGKTGGYANSSQSTLENVGCESCHGPGGNHIKENSRKIGSILALGDKCDSCVILQICSECHDEKNDPGFTYKVQDKIDRQRHGTIEPGTGKPKPADKPFKGASIHMIPALLDSPTAVLGLLEHGFRGVHASPITRSQQG